MRGKWPTMRQRWRGALFTALFGCVVAGPIKLLDSGIGWDAVLVMLVGGVAGAVVGFVFPYGSRPGETPGFASTVSALSAASPAEMT